MKVNGNGKNGKSFKLMGRDPPLHLTLTEWPRATIEFGDFLSKRKEMVDTFPRPEEKGIAVLIIPGLLTGDWSTIPLRWLLTQLGYIVYGWDQGTNLYYNDDVGMLLYRKFSEICQKHGRVILIGWSLGGMYVKVLSARYPKRTKRVITLGSPYVVPEDTLIADVYKMLAGDIKKIDSSLLEMMREYPLVPTTSIFSLKDGFIPPHTCRINPSPFFNSVTLSTGSHCGLGHNPIALKELCEVLARDDYMLPPQIEKRNNFSIDLNGLFQRN